MRYYRDWHFFHFIKQLTNSYNILIDTQIDEELKLKRLQTTKATIHHTSIKNKKRDYKISEAQKDFAFGRLVNNKLISWNMTSKVCFITYNILIAKNFFTKN